MANTFNYDVFLSHNSSDKPAVEHIARLLRSEYKLNPWLDKWNLVPGDPWQEAIETALDDCRTVAVFVGPSKIGPWENEEMRAAIEERVKDSKRRVIPVLLPGAPDSKDLNLPRFLRRATWVDFRAGGLDDQDALHRLHCGILGQPPGDHFQLSNIQPSTAPWHFPHRYGDRPNFTGRVVERKLLTDWLNADGQPLYILRALGGFGKSALSWYWLNNDVDKTKWQRVSWWSFYEGDASFEHFLGDTLEYLGIQDANKMNPRQQTAVLLGQLQDADILLVLDGFERALRAFSGMGAAYQGDGDESPSPSGRGARGEGEGESRGRDCVSPAAEDFLRGLNDPKLHSKILMTTRLCPHVLEYQDGELQPGSCEKELTALTPEDAYTFFTEKEKITATRAEVRAACAPYDYHPLSLNLLAGLIKKDFEYPRDIRAAGKYYLNSEIKNHKEHILKAAYETLPAERQQLLSQIACLRGSADYDTIKTILSPAPKKQGFLSNLFSKSEAVPGIQHLDESLNDLQERGLLQVTTLSSSNHLLSTFDLHPIVRRYAYERLTAPDKIAAHTRLADYFAAVPEHEKIEKLDDLAAVIELYHHQVRAGKYTEAEVMYYDRLRNVIYFQFGAYQTIIELLRTLFPNGENELPLLDTDDKKAFTLNELANAYSLSGQPRRAVPLFEMVNALKEKAGDKQGLAIELGNVAQQQLVIGALAQAERNLRRRIDLCREIEDELNEAIGHRESGRVLSYRGAWQAAEQELDTGLKLFEKQGVVQSEGVVWSYRALRCLLMAREALVSEQSYPTGTMSVVSYQQSAVENAKRALELADETARTIYPHERDYIRAHWLLGAAYCASAACPGRSTAGAQSKDDLLQAETHLGEALRRCRAINNVETEADILLEVAKLRHLQGETPEALRLAREALLITERSGYVLQGADVNLFLAELAESREKRAESSEWGGRETALMHANKARALATCDGGEYVYKVAYDEAGRMIRRLALSLSKG